MDMENKELATKNRLFSLKGLLATLRKHFRNGKSSITIPCT